MQVPGLPPTQTGQGWMPGMVSLGSVAVSPVRKISESSGRLMFCVPSPQSTLPETAVFTELITQVLVGVLPVLGMGSGPPKKQPGEEQLRSLPVSVDVVGPTVAVCTAQLVNWTTVWPRSGVIAGSGTAFSPPP